MDQRFRRGFTAAEKTELWDRWQGGESLKAISRAFGQPPHRFTTRWRRMAAFVQLSHRNITTTTLYYDVNDKMLKNAVASA